MAKQHAWDLNDEHDADGALTASAYEQLVDLAGSLLDTMNRLGGQVTIAAKRLDTGERIAGIKVFETVGFVVVHQDHVPGLPTPPAEPPAETPAVEEGE
jgi:predicted kinase